MTKREMRKLGIKPSLEEETFDILSEEEKEALRAVSSKKRFRSIDPRARKFARLYVLIGEGKRAAELAGYGGNPTVVATRLRRRADINALIAYYDAVREKMFEEEVNGCLAALVELRDNKKSPPSIRLKAATEILDRAGYGRVERKEIDFSAQGVSEERVGLDDSSLADPIKRLMVQIAGGINVR